MSEHNQNPSNFNAQFHEQEIHRGKRYGKKKRSWVSIIIHLIILILTAITGYSMLKQPILTLLSLIKQLISMKFKTSKIL